jgi:hypothetical protein
MAEWNAADLDRFGAAGEIDVTTLRADGSVRGYVPVWVVRVGDSLYVRSYRGRDGAWYRHAVHRPRGRIRAGTVERDVAFDATNDAAQDAIDGAYRSKYARHGATHVERMVNRSAQAATLRLLPHSAGKDN